MCDKVAAFVDALGFDGRNNIGDAGHTVEDTYYDAADEDDDENAKRERQAEAPKVNAKRKHR